MTAQEHEAIIRNTMPSRADVSASWAQDVGMAKGFVEPSRQTIEEVSASIDEYLLAQRNRPTSSPSADDGAPPLTEDQVAKAASDVTAFLGGEGEGVDRPDAPLSDVDRDVMRYFGCDG